MTDFGNSLRVDIARHFLPCTTCWSDLRRVRSCVYQCQQDIAVYQSVDCQPIRQTSFVADKDNKRRVYGFMCQPSCLLLTPISVATWGMQVGQLPRPLTTVVRLDPAICANPTRNLLGGKIGVAAGGTPLAEDRHIQYTPWQMKSVKNTSMHKCVQHSPTQNLQCPGVMHAYSAVSAFRDEISPDPKYRIWKYGTW